MRPAACDALLSDGDIVHLRPTIPEDRDELLAFHSHLSPESLHLRFLGVGSQSARSYVESLTRAPAADHLALVAVSHGRIVGVAGYERGPDPDEAEVAMVVDDALHGRGIGTLLLEHLAHAARANGLRRLTASVLWGNTRMLDVLTLSGMRHTRSLDGGAVDIVIPLEVRRRCCARSTNASGWQRCTAWSGCSARRRWRWWVPADDAGRWAERCCATSSPMTSPAPSFRSTLMRTRLVDCRPMPAFDSFPVPSTSRCSRCRPIRSRTWSATAVTVVCTGSSCSGRALRTSARQDRQPSGSCCGWPVRAACG